MKKFLFGLLCLFLAFVAFMIAYMSVQKGTTDFFYFILVFAIIYFLWRACSSKAVNSVREWKILFFISAVAFALRLFWVLAVQTVPISDFAIHYNAAQAIADGDFSVFNKTGYFQTWAYYTPFVLYQAAILKIFGSIFALKLMNVIFMTGINVIFYLICRKIAGKQIAIFAALLYAFYPGPVFMASVLTPQHISIFFMYLSVFCFLCLKRRPASFIASGIFLAIGNLMRPEAIIIIVSLLFSLFAFISEWANKKNIKEILVHSALLISLFCIIYYGAGATISGFGINVSGIKNSSPYWKFITGLNIKSGGGYSEEHSEILNMTSAEQKKYLLDFIRNQHETYPASRRIDFFKQKIGNMWGRDEALYWSTGHMDTSKKYLGMTIKEIFIRLNYIERAIYIVITFFIGYFGLNMYKKKRYDFRVFFLMSMFLCNFAVYVLTEIQVRYRYFIFPVMFLLGAYGFSLFCEKYALFPKTNPQKTLQ